MEITATERDSVQINQRRPVRYKYEPTTTSTLFCSRSVAHQVIAIGDPGTKAGVTTFELAKRGNKADCDITRPPAASVDAASRIVGYTDKPDDEIEQYGKPLLPLFQYSA
jgi:hypothetical protein